MTSYYTNENGKWFVDPIVKNHIGLNKKTEADFKAFLAAKNKPTTEQLLHQLTQARKEQERQGVTLNSIRYAGDLGNRQALQEAIAFMDDSALTEFPKWKDSDNNFHIDHPLSDVFDAYRAIGIRRVSLIEAEGNYAVEIVAGTLTELSDVVWP
jgi:hypothetical protein